MLDAGANRARGGGICSAREPIVRGEGEYARCGSQSCEGRGNMPGRGRARAVAWYSPTASSPPTPSSSHVCHPHSNIYL
eukprot:1190409-Prorocentrum_minimum.AAC.3